MKNLNKVILLTEEEYLTDEITAEIRHEYINGQIYAMAGANERHNLIAGNLYYHLRTATRGSECRVFINDMKLRIEKQHIFYYPDVMLCCNPQDNHELYKQYPCLIAEILSPSTETIDRREKLMTYQTIPSLHYYLLIATHEKKIEYYQTNEEGSWYNAILDNNEILEIDCLPNKIIPLYVEDLYQDVIMP